MRRRPAPCADGHMTTSAAPHKPPIHIPVDNYFKKISNTENFAIVYSSIGPDTILVIYIIYIFYDVIAVVVVVLRVEFS